MTLSGCASMDEFRAEVEARDHTLIEGPDQLPLEIPAGGVFSIGTYESNFYPPPNVQIAYTGPACPNYCWEQVVRVLTNGCFTDSIDDLEVVENYHVDNEGSTTTCAANQNSRRFQDDPHEPDVEFGFCGKVAVFEFETCLRCVDSTQYLGCVNWYYIRYKGAEEANYVITKDTVDEPSATFRRTINAWPP